MKKIYAPVILLFLSTTTFGQIKFAPEAGLNMAMQTNRILPPLSEFSLTHSSKLSPGVTAGINLDIKVLRNLYVNVGTFYSFNNVKYNYDVDFSKFGLGTLVHKQYDRVHYIKAPLYIMYKSGFEGMGRFTAGIGMYAAYAVGGNTVDFRPDSMYDDGLKKYSVTYVNSNTEMKFGEDVKDNLWRWDYGLNACMGYESNIGLYFRGSVSYGLVNLDPQNLSERRIRNWGFGLSFGYLIGKDNW